MAITPPDEKMTTPPRQTAAGQAFQMTTSLRADDIFADSLQQVQGSAEDAGRFGHLQAGGPCRLLGLLAGGACGCWLR
jgi:hypothetical protein